MQREIRAQQVVPAQREPLETPVQPGQLEVQEQLVARDQTEQQVELVLAEVQPGPPAQLDREEAAVQFVREPLLIKLLILPIQPHFAARL